jgi:hypothetical protein
MASESRRLEEQFRRACALWWKDLHWELHKFHADEYSGKGFPDFMGSYRGIAFGCEIKSQSDRPTADQKAWANLNRSCYVFCIKELDGVLYLLNREQFIGYSLRQKEMWTRLDMYQALGENNSRAWIPRLDPLESLLHQHRSQAWQSKK